MADLSAPVALDLLTALLDVSEAAAGVALLLVGVVTIARHVTGLAAVVAQLLALLLGLLAVSGDVTSSAAVVAGILCALAVSGHVPKFATSVTEQVFASAATFPSPSAATRTVLHPVA